MQPRLKRLNNYCNLFIRQTYRTGLQTPSGMRLDCDGDALLLLVDQLGPACHTGRRSCFYNAVRGNRVEVIDTRFIAK
ncbi:MAG: phosphoribosyl-AMP cyclohydrolase [Methylobacter sp.]|nr:phosphoribosyl-AMP cyclohydrolase [Methylobacter sp.]